MDVNKLGTYMNPVDESQTKKILDSLDYDPTYPNHYWEDANIDNIEGIVIKIAQDWINKNKQALITKIEAKLTEYDKKIEKLEKDRSNIKTLLSTYRADLEKAWMGESLIAMYVHQMHI